MKLYAFANHLLLGEFCPKADNTYTAGLIQRQYSQVYPKYPTTNPVKGKHLSGKMGLIALFTNTLLIPLFNDY